ncbi:MAG: aryl-sulfate sulfotransferase, partial [Myxococcota bacterium]
MSTMLMVLTLLLANAPDADTIAELEALGYVDSAPTENPNERGVTLKRRRAYDGINLLSSRHHATAHLVDMDGEIVHTWKDPGATQWMHVELMPNGDILALTKDTYLSRLDYDSKVIWRRKLRIHHDFTVAPNGNILALSRRVSKKRFRG